MGKTGSGTEVTEVRTVQALCREREIGHETNYAANGINSSELTLSISHMHEAELR